MPLTTGTRLLSYEITKLLGAGGMGEVYQARDLKLNRKVAIKVLPSEFAREPERLARFRHEGQAIAALNHPNIAAIHEIDESGATTFLVLELVEGETLAERIRRGPIPVEEALNIAHQMCEALEAAHSRGVIHRDLKPANVKITPDGKVKVLDFGLAKTIAQSGASVSLSNSPTLLAGGTIQGVILGTAAYMSPEQAKGLDVDARSDIFSFGCVVFEMLTGRQAFHGETVSEVLASVLKSEPDWTLLPKDVTDNARTLLQRALDKRPRQRWYAIGDVRVEIEAMANPNPVAVQLPTVPSRPLWKRLAWAGVFAALGAAIASFAVWSPSPPAPHSVMRFPIMLPEAQPNSSRPLLSISPDGTKIVYVTRQGLYLRSLADVEARLIAGTEVLRDATNPVFSPDGNSIAFWAGVDQTLKTVPAQGGTPVTLAKATAPIGMSWGPDGIVFNQDQNIMRISPQGGKPELLVSVDVGETPAYPQVLPDKQSLLFVLAKKGQIVIQSLKSGERKSLVDGGGGAFYSSTGHIVYARGRTLLASPFDLRTLTITGNPLTVVEGIRRVAATAGSAAQFSISSNGSLIYVPGPVSPGQRGLSLIDRSGNTKLLDLPPKLYATPRVSPDGSRIAFGTEDEKESVIWIYDLAGTSAVRRLTVEGRNRYPVWSADSARVAFQSNREGDLGIFWQRADGAGGAERLTTTDKNTAHIPDSWSPDGQKLSFTVESATELERTIWVFSLKDRKATPFAAEPRFLLGNSVFSPDGRWLAYQLAGPSRGEVWVQPFPPTGTKYLISNEMGGQPLWSPDGKELLFIPAPNQLYAMMVTTRPGFTFTNPVKLPWAGIASPFDLRAHDILPDGRRFVAVVDAERSGSAARVPQIRVVLNWIEDLKQNAERE